MSQPPIPWYALTCNTRLYTVPVYSRRIERTAPDWICCSTFWRSCIATYRMISRKLLHTERTYAQLTYKYWDDDVCIPIWWSLFCLICARSTRGSALSYWSLICEGGSQRSQAGRTFAGRVRRSGSPCRRWWWWRKSKLWSDGSRWARTVENRWSHKAATLCKAAGPVWHSAPIWWWSSW